MQAQAWHRSKIVCTLGPATDAAGILERLIRAGMDVARINMSHGSQDEHARRITAVRGHAQRLGQAVAILADLPGPKFRLGAIPEGARTLVEGSAVVLAAASATAPSLPVRNPELLAALMPGEPIYLADGTLELRVTTGGAEGVVCEVIIGGTVRSGSGINVPTASLHGLVPTADDRRHLAFALAHKVEWIGVSFVQSAGDLGEVRACFPEGAGAFLMAKIEKRRALSDLDAIVDAADGVMVARGDLGVETDLAEIPLVQKRIIATANARGRPVVTATQMLESMIQHEHPTRAEVTDVANAVLDGTDAVMLSGETAVGKHPAAAVQILNRVLTATEADYAERMARQALQADFQEPADAVSYVACELAQRLQAAAIVASAEKLPTAAAIARLRPSMPIVLITRDLGFARALSMLRGVISLHVESTPDSSSELSAVRRRLFEAGLAAPGAQAVLISAAAPQAKADTIQVVHL